jgi:hypothetical protein
MASMDDREATGRASASDGRSWVWRWLVLDWQWPAAAAVSGVGMLLALPGLAPRLGWPLGLVYLQLPFYLLHQAEEHLGDRFRRYVNKHLFAGRDVLTRTATFWINSLGVWAADLLALDLAGVVSLAAGLFAGYLAAVNGVMHVAQAIGRREYNPGLWTAIGLLLPGGAICVAVVGRAAGCGWGAHVAALAAAIGIHAVIIAWIAVASRPSSRPA